MEQISELEDFIIEECIPSCETCTCIWTSKNIKHRIVCKCKKCDHGISVRESHMTSCTSDVQKVSDTPVTMTGTREKENS